MRSGTNDRGFWSGLLSIQPSTAVSSLGIPSRTLSGARGVHRLGDTFAYVRGREDGTIAGIFWATAEGALLRVLEGDQPGILELDDGGRNADPPSCLLPKTADGQGTYGSIRIALRANLGRVMESATYRITSDGAFLYRELSGGHTGMRWLYRALGGDADPVAVISLGVAREDWRPDRTLVQLG